ncbi:MAG: alanine/glycine:cation symporter family protein [Putridiphycobacter sp.]|nr:alanine/glycine:cation symporter family protein [Putridiphycobacter sp.]
MLKKLTVLFLGLFPFLLSAQEKGLDQKIDETFGNWTGWFVDLIFFQIPFTDKIKVPWVLIVLVLGALFFTLYFKFINIRGFSTSINVIRGKYDDFEKDGHVEVSDTVFTDDGDNPDTIRVEGDHHGEVSHFQALTAALSATVGLGNIAGVAVAISIGGPGATFWMIVAGLIGMASKFVECTLGVKYREIDETGKVFGGPMYYLKKGLKANKMAKLGQVLAVLFAIMCIGGSFGGGNMFQSNQAFAMIEYSTQTDVSKVNDLNSIIGEKVKYSYFESEERVVSSVSKDSIYYTINDRPIARAKKEFLGDSMVVAGTGSGIDVKADLSQFIGQTIVASLPRTIDTKVAGIDGDMVRLDIGNMEMSVTSKEFSKTAVLNPLSGNGWIFGIIMAVLVGVVIIGGIKKIAKVTDKIVPFMVVTYVLAALVILGMHFDQIPNAFGQIFTGAFSGIGIIGGTVGVLIQGFKRAAFSNEAGIGSASIAHSAVKTKYAASEGLVALLEPFIDTVLVCTMTALVLIISNGNGEIMTYGQEIKEGVQVTSQAFESNIFWFPWVLTIAVVLFAFSTMISWSYYGYQAWSFLFGRSKKIEYAYKFIFCLFVIVGAASQLKSVIDFSDAMIFAMLVPNMIGLFLLAPRVKEELARFMKRVKAQKA